MNNNLWPRWVEIMLVLVAGIVAGWILAGGQNVRAETAPVPAASNWKSPTEYHLDRASAESIIEFFRLVAPANGALFVPLQELPPEAVRQGHELCRKNFGPNAELLGGLLTPPDRASTVCLLGVPGHLASALASVLSNALDRPVTFIDLRGSVFVFQVGGSPL